MKASMFFRVSGLGLGGLSKQVIASVFRTLLSHRITLVILAVDLYTY